MRLVGVHDGGEFEFGVDDLVASGFGRRVEAGEDDGLTDRDVLVHGDLTSVRADDARHLVADGERHLPPTFGPRAHAARRPSVGVSLESVERLARHRAEAMRDKVSGLVEYRELAPPLKKLVRQEPPPPLSDVAQYIRPQIEWLL